MAARIKNGGEKQRTAQQPKQLQQYRRDDNSPGARKQKNKNKSKQNRTMA